MGSRPASSLILTCCTLQKMNWSQRKIQWGALITLRLKVTMRLCNMPCCLIRLYRLDIKVELVCYTCVVSAREGSHCVCKAKPDPQPLLSVAEKGCREGWRILGANPGHAPRSCSLFWSVISGTVQRREKETLPISSFLQHSNDSTSSEGDVLSVGGHTRHQSAHFSTWL